MPLQQAVNALLIFSAEWERGFSQINIIREIMATGFDFYVLVLLYIVFPRHQGLGSTSEQNISWYGISRLENMKTKKENMMSKNEVCYEQ